MRKLICCITFMLALLTVQASSPIKGLRIESTGQPVVVCINGEQVCTASTSCFVANLQAGSYKVEVYAVNPGRRGEVSRRGELLYNERVHYSGVSVQDILVNTAPAVQPDRGTRNMRYDAMSDDTFNRFYQSFKGQAFESDRYKLLDSTAVTAYFTSDQCRRLVSLFHFDDERMKIMKTMYPKIVDPSSFFVVLDLLVFDSAKNEMNKFIKNYHATAGR